MYTETNFKSKKAFKEAVKSGAIVTVFSPGPFTSTPSEGNREVSVEGPHYPAPHTWYARAVINKYGVVQKVIG